MPNQPDTDIIILPKLKGRILTKKVRLDLSRPLPEEALKKLIQDIRLKHTYNSNAIEGNTLTLQETRLILEHGITIGGKTITEHLEARNTAEAFDFTGMLADGDKGIDHEAIQELHSLVKRGISHDAGKYRTLNVRIQGAIKPTPDFGKVPRLMEEYVKEIQTFKDPLAGAVFVHYRFVAIHPFSDGNGRIARLLTNLYLMGHGYPPTVLPVRDRQRYYRVLRDADNGNLQSFTDFIARSIDHSLTLYLACLGGEYELLPLSALAKFTKYSQEYLSLRARQGILEAVKMDGKWYSTKRAIKVYIRAYKK
jgi:Fic family protein